MGQSRGAEAGRCVFEDRTRFDAGGRCFLRGGATPVPLVGQCESVRVVQACSYLGGQTGTGPVWSTPPRCCCWTTLTSSPPARLPPAPRTSGSGTLVWLPWRSYPRCCPATLPSHRKVWRLSVAVAMWCSCDTQGSGRTTGGALSFAATGCCQERPLRLPAGPPGTGCGFHESVLSPPSVPHRSGQRWPRSHWAQSRRSWGLESPEGLQGGR